MNAHNGIIRESWRINYKSREISRQMPSKKIKNAERISIFSLPYFVTLSDGKYNPLAFLFWGKIRSFA